MDELVKMLRVCGDSNNSCENCPIRENDGGCPHGEWEFAAEKYMLQAADAIEELAAFKAQITDGRFYVYKLGTLFELRHDPRELVVRHQDPTEPPKEE